MAALLMDRKGLEPLRLALCMLPAITSLPVPLSPVIRIVSSVRAKQRARSSNS